MMSTTCQIGAAVRKIIQQNQSHINARIPIQTKLEQQVFPKTTRQPSHLPHGQSSHKAATVLLIESQREGPTLSN